MPILTESEKLPLETDSSGVIRLKGTRVTLDTVIAAFSEGATPEEIAQQYPTLALSDIYMVLGFYLHRREEVDDYLRKRQEVANQVRSENERRFRQEGIRDRLLARKAHGSKART